MRANEEAYERGRKRAKKKAAARAKQAGKTKLPVIRGRARANELAYERGKKRAKKKAAARARKASTRKLPVIRGRARANERAYERGKARARASRQSGARNQPVLWRPWPGGGGGGGGGGFPRGSQMGGGAQRGPGKPFIPETALPFTNAREVGAYLRLFRPTGPVLQQKLKRAGWSSRPERARGAPNYIRLPDGRKVRSRSQGPGAIWTSPDGNYTVRIMNERIVGGLRRRAIISKKVTDRQGREHWQPLDKDGKPAGRDKTHHVLETVPVRRGLPEPGVPFRPGEGGHL